jgi:hypothetical protein
MATVAFLKNTPNPTDEEIRANVTNRCGTYDRIRKAIHRAAARVKPMPVPSAPEVQTPELSPPEPHERVFKHHMLLW